MVRARPFLVMVFAVLAAMPPRASRGAEPPDTEAIAIGIYRQGVGLFRLQDYRGALDKFIAAYSVHQLPLILQNIARCHEELGDTRKAVEYFERYLQLASDPEDRADAERRLQRLRPLLLATLQLRGGSAGWEVAIDGRSVGHTPLEPIEVAGGSRVVRLSRAGHSRELAVEVPDGGEVVVDLDALGLEPASGRLLLTGGRAGDRVTIDGQAVAWTLGEPLELEAGDRQLQVQRAERPPFSMTARVDAGQDTTVAVEIPDPPPAGTDPWPWVTVGLGAAALTTAGILTGLGYSDHDTAERIDRSTRPAEYNEWIDSGNTKLYASYALYAVGGALVVTGLVLLLLPEDEPADASAGAFLVPTPGGAALGWQGRF